MLRFLQFSFSRTVAVTGIAMNDGTPGISATSFHSRSKYRGCGGGAAKPAMRSKGGAPAKRPLMAWTGGSPPTFTEGVTVT